MKLQTLKSLAVFLLLEAAPAFAVESPADTVRAALDGLSRSEISPIISRLSDLDRKKLAGIYSSHEQPDLQFIKSQLNLDTATTAGWQEYDYRVANDLRGYGVLTKQKDTALEKAYQMAFIKDQWTKGDYAEVDLVFPYDVYKYSPPVIRFILFKESGIWKISWFSTTFVTFSITIRPMSRIIMPYIAGDYTDFMLSYIYGDEFLMKQQGRVRLEKFSMYRRLRELYSNLAGKAKGYVAQWATTGDPAGVKKYAEQRGAGDPAAGHLPLGLSHDRSAKNPYFSLPMDGQLDILNYALIPRQLALVTFLGKVAGDKKMCAKTTYQIAENYEHTQEFPLAAEAYLDLLNKYPEAEDVIKAKGNLAKIYWERLGKQDEAGKLWKELEAVGKLPVDVPYNTTGGIIPKTMVRNTETGYMRGIMDFDIDADRKWVDVLYSSGTEKIGGKEYCPAQNFLVRYHEDGQNKVLFNQRMVYNRQASPNYTRYDQIQESKAGIWLYTTFTNGHALFLSAEGKPLKRLRDEGSVLSEIPVNGQEGPYPWKYSNEEAERSPYWYGAHFGDRVIFVYAANSVAIKIYDAKTLKLISKNIPSPEAKLGNYHAHMLPSKNGRIFVVSPGAGEVLEYNNKGKLMNTIKDARVLSGARSWTPVDIVRSVAGELLIADSANRRIVKYSLRGKYLGEFDLKPYLKGWIRRIRLDSRGCLYVLSGEMNQQDVILRFDGDVFKK